MLPREYRMGRRSESRHGDGPAFFVIADTDTASAVWHVYYVSLRICILLDCWLATGGSVVVCVCPSLRVPHPRSLAYESAIECRAGIERVAFSR